MEAVLHVYSRHISVSNDWPAVTICHWGPDLFLRAGTNTVSIISLESDLILTCQESPAKPIQGKLFMYTVFPVLELQSVTACGCTARRQMTTGNGYPSACPSTSIIQDQRIEQHDSKSKCSKWSAVQSKEIPSGEDRPLHSAAEKCCRGMFCILMYWLS